MAARRADPRARGPARHLVTALMPPPEGLLVPPGQGRTVRTPAQHVTFKVTGTHSRTASSFEVVVPPGFDVGAHVHSRSEELFYVLEGELDVLAFEPLVPHARQLAALAVSVRATRWYGRHRAR